MSKNNTNTEVTVESVAAQAVEEKLVVPTQPEGEKMDTVTVEDHEAPKLETVEGGKKTLKERLIDRPIKNMRESKTRRYIVIGAVIAGAAVVTLAKFAAKKAVEELEQAIVEESDETQNDSSNESEQNTTDNA